MTVTFKNNRKIATAGDMIRMGRKARLPKEKAATIKLIDTAPAGKIALKPEYMRAL